ncbi:three-Cys-motif partner protein TcmP [Hymenobacter busanensis]|uniref:Three-Cys-motif partner protein TcmP n=1 Tax=Hymenobacter busanensis TaxID=2607656 RepID=A0A7L5A3K5_9BACT|nr:three-Cys-motif partner protein TcmP [Hymenobacter busanensis]KAA9338441.1 three-Cys-motif partner protein TcmP [Hymenobacter busanensis]QHJ09132.1 three-Cys-motif partner protein TcmP [Hymenobacter busanensis]
MNEFGGVWTEEKIEAFMKYVKAYLQVMKNRTHFRLLYFDGFAGSGTISPDEDHDPEQFIQGVATQVLSITEPREFDAYFFVEKNPEHAQSLSELIRARFPDKRVRVVEGDCNEKLMQLATYMRNPERINDRALVFIDPYGMQLSWSTIEALRGAEMDVWILVPTGVAIGRLLKNNGEIQPGWMARLQDFLGMSPEEIKAYFYRQETSLTLFGEETVTVKQDKASERAGRLYGERIRSANIFRHVSEPLVLRNSRNAILYHFILCSNNATALRIANDINKKMNRK